MNNKEGEILSLTGLRFVAALYVFIFHIHIRWPLTSNNFVSNIVGQGAVGMSLFFILSGFVLAYRYAGQSFTVSEYLKNRFARIYPIYFVAALITLPWLGFDIIGMSITDTVKAICKVVLIVTSNIFLVQAWFPQFFGYWNDGGSWSISVEAFCYLMLPLMLPYLLRASTEKLFLTIAICWVWATLPGISATLFDAPTNPVFYSMPVFRLPEFLVGVCSFLLIRRGFIYQHGVLAQIIVILFFLFYLGFVGSTMSNYVGHNWIVIPVVAFMIFSLSNNKGIISLILSSRIFVWLGKISYCFYSFQVFILLFMTTYHAKLVEIIPALSNNIILMVVSFFVLVAMSAAGYYFIEEPARKFIRMKGGRVEMATSQS